MTPEERAHAVIWDREDHSPPGLLWLLDEERTDDKIAAAEQAIAQAIREAKRETYEDACKQVCHMCESGGVPATRQNEHGREYGQWFHDYGSVGIERCHASPIRARVYWLAQQGVIPTQENLVIENVEMYEIKPSS